MEIAAVGICRLSFRTDENNIANEYANDHLDKKKQFISFACFYPVSIWGISKTGLEFLSHLY
jgi:hypothetical protein